MVVLLGATWVNMPEKSRSCVEIEARKWCESSGGGCGTGSIFACGFGGFMVIFWCFVDESGEISRSTCVLLGKKSSSKGGIATIVRKSRGGGGGGGGIPLEASRFSGLGLWMELVHLSLSGDLFDGADICGFLSVISVLLGSACFTCSALSYPLIDCLLTGSVSSFSLFGVFPPCSFCEDLNDGEIFDRSSSSRSRTILPCRCVPLSAPSGSSWSRRFTVPAPGSYNEL